MPSSDAYRDKFDRFVSMIGTALPTDRRREDSVAIEVPTRRQRTQVVHLDYRPSTDEEPPRIVVQSSVGAVPRRLDREDLLRRNAGLEAGAICITDVSTGDGQPQPYLAVRATHLLSTADEREVWALVEAVAHAADGLEYDLFARDDL